MVRRAWQVWGASTRRAHDLTLRLLGLAQRAPGALALLERLFAVRDPRLTVRVAGLTFPNPARLAGLDKDARAPALRRLGLGAVEVGTVTPGARRATPARASSASPPKGP